jgi:hypothetical protein
MGGTVAPPLACGAMEGGLREQFVRLGRGGGEGRSARTTSLVATQPWLVLKTISALWLK